jgi:hypothetical protein
LASRNINIGIMKINEVEIGSIIGIGKNLQMSVYTTLNANQGFGIETSDGSVYHSLVGKVWDSDMFDDNHVYKGG